jgi:hypothetical protein
MDQDSRKENFGGLRIKTEDAPTCPVYTYHGNFHVYNIRDEVDEALLPYCGRSIAIM